MAQDFSSGPVLYSVTAQNGAIAQWSVLVTEEVDAISPVITLLGSNPYTLFTGNSYTDPDATALDNKDGDISANIIIDASAVNVNVPGSYSITYNVSDSSGNPAIEVVRTVNVNDTSVPVITLLGSNPLALTVGESYVELGATATDDVDGDISANIIIDASAVNVNVPGSYSITYNVSDSSGNPAIEVVRTVNVNDVSVPVITLLGSNPLALTIGESYVELGATATDDVDGDISVNIIIDASAVNVNVPGSYSVTYNVSDSSGNPAIEVVRIVNVEEAIPTVLTTTGFVLVNAITNQDIMAITNGMSIDINALPTTSLNIRANATPDTKSMRLVLSGALTKAITENVAPFALYGDINSNYTAQTFVLGSYTLTATPYSQTLLNGTQGTPLTISFVISDVDPVCLNFEPSISEINNVTSCLEANGTATVSDDGNLGSINYLWSHDSNLNSNTAINLAPGNYSVTVSNESCSKILNFTIQPPAGPNVSLASFSNVLDNAAPFQLTGGLPTGGTYSGIGVNNGTFEPSIGAGTYTITYTYTDGNGCSASANKNITVQSTSVLSTTGFVLVNAITNQDIMAITNGMSIDINALPTTSLNIRANATPDTKSMRLVLSGALSKAITENVAPFALYGDINSNYNAQTFVLGSYSLTATPYSQTLLNGTKGTPLTIGFQLVSSQLLGLKAVFDSETYPSLNLVKPNKLELYPNLASVETKLRFTNPTKIQTVMVFDMSGKLIGTFNANEMKTGEEYILSVFTMQSGVYSIRTIDENGRIYEKRLVVKH